METTIQQEVTVAGGFAQAVIHACSAWFLDGTVTLSVFFFARD